MPVYGCVNCGGAIILSDTGILTLSSDIMASCNKCIVNYWLISFENSYIQHTAEPQRRLVMRHQEYTEVCGGIHIYGKGHK